VLNDIIDTMVDETKYWGTEYLERKYA
jgi:hypothetical protein